MLAHKDPNVARRMRGDTNPAGDVVDDEFAGAGEPIAHLCRIVVFNVCPGGSRYKPCAHYDQPDQHRRVPHWSLLTASVNRSRTVGSRVVDESSVWICGFASFCFKSTSVS